MCDKANCFSVSVWQVNMVMPVIRKAGPAGEGLLEMIISAKTDHTLCDNCKEDFENDPTSFDKIVTNKMWDDVCNAFIKKGIPVPSRDGTKLGFEPLHKESFAARKAAAASRR
jgi:hypothetical protein